MRSNPKIFIALFIALMLVSFSFAEVKIAKVMVNPSGPSENEGEYVTLYNTSADGYNFTSSDFISLYYNDSPVDTISLDGLSIQGSGFITIGNNNYSGPVDMNWGGLTMSNNNGSVEIYVDGNTDIIGWGAVIMGAEGTPLTDPSEGTGFERKAIASSTAESNQDGGKHEYYGNGTIRMIMPMILLFRMKVIWNHNVNGMMLKG